MTTPTTSHAPGNTIDAHRLIDEFLVTLLPGTDALDLLASRLDRIAYPSLTDRISRTRLRRALALEVSVVVWDLRRPSDWRFCHLGQITTRAICTSVPEGMAWWADHTRLECYTAGVTPESGAQRPANYWGRLHTLVYKGVLERRIAAWWNAEHPTISWNKRWVHAISRPLSEVNRDLGISLAVAALQIPYSVFDVYNQIAALWVPRLPGSTREIEIEPSVVQHIWQCLPNYLRIIDETPTLLFAFHMSAYGSGPGPWARSAQDLKARLMDHGVTKYGWRLLVRHGSRLFAPWVRIRIRAATPFARIAEAIALQQVMQDGRTIPAWFVMAIIRAHQSECPDCQIRRGWSLIATPVLRLAAEQALRRTSKASRNALRHELVLVVRWGHVHGRADLAPHAVDGWKVLIQNVKDAFAKSHAANQACLAKFDFVHIHSDEDFASEGRLLQNCFGTDDWLAAARSHNNVRHYSIRLKGLPIRVGAATLRSDPGTGNWTVEKTEGPANTSASLEITMAATAFAAYLSGDQ